MGLKAYGFAVGAAAGAVAVSLAAFLRTLAGGVFLPEIGVQALLTLIPGKTEAQVVIALGFLAKNLALMVATLANLTLYGAIGMFFSVWREKVHGAQGGVVLSLFAYLVVLLAALLLRSLSEVSANPLPLHALAFYLLFPQVAFGFITSHLLSKRRLPTKKLTVSYRRRLLIRAGGLTAGGVALALLLYGLGRLFSESEKMPPDSLPRPKTVEKLPPSALPLLMGEVTPNDLFYRVDVNLFAPQVDGESWRLRVTGLVESNLELTLEDLKAIPAVEQYATLECVSNEIGGSLISTALWKGAPLKELLEKARVKPEAEYIIFKCFDGYDVSIPLSRGLDGTILAYEMNGSPLPAEHGYPLRAIVPGLYGMMNAKWIVEIELVRERHAGFWQRKGWSSEAEYKTHSTIVVPGESPLRVRFPNLTPPLVKAGSENIVAGVAFAGDRGIAKVEVSVDGGRSWQTASIKPPLSYYTWVLWAAEWSPPTKGEYRLVVRATDKRGEVQTAEFRSPFPDGATGYHVVEIKVVEGE